MRTPTPVQVTDRSWCVACGGDGCSACLDPQVSATCTPELLYGVGVGVDPVDAEGTVRGHDRHFASWASNLGWDVSEAGAESDARDLAWVLLRVAQLDQLTAAARKRGGDSPYGAAGDLAARSSAEHAQMLERWPPLASPKMKAMVAAWKARADLNRSVEARRRFVAPLRSIRFELFGAIVRTTACSASPRSAASSP